MWMKRLILVWAAVLAAALVGSARATAASAPIWIGDNLLGVVAASQQIQALSALAVGDVDGNGWEDYVVADSATNTLHVLLLVDSPIPGVGTSLVYATGNDPSSVAIGDLNGDSILDLVVANAGDGTITVRLGVDNGAGTTPRFEWPTPITYATGGSPQSDPLSVAIGDLDHDGHNDIAVANFGSSNPADDDQGSVTVLRNDCCGGFPDRTELGIEHPLSLAIGDLNGDTRRDLVVTNTQSGVPSVSVLLQDNLGVLVDTYAQPVGAMPRHVHIADLNDDGMPDLVTANEGADTVSLLLSDNAQPPGGQLFAHRIDVATGGQPRSVAVADLNGDGVLDLATANGSGTVSVLPGVGNGTFLAREDIPNDSSPTALVPDSPVAIAAVDWLFANDSRPDLVVVGGGANPLDVLVNDTPPDTPAGSPVVVTPVDRNAGDSPVTITFDSVSSAGVTTLRTSASGPPPPVGFLINGLYYYLETTAAFTTAKVCFPYTGSPPAIVHWVGGIAVIEPTTLDTGSEVCAVVSSFSPFALAQPEGGVDVDAPVVVCGSADGAWHADNVSIACTAEDAASGLADPADAAFSLSTSIPPGTEDGNASTGSRQVCDLAGNCATAGPIGGNKIDRKAPALTLPADRTVDATGPGGVAVSYSATATDGADPSPTVSCAPASGAVFAIGSTTVVCTATDQVGNAGSGSFHITVLGAKDQLNRLIQKVVGASKLPPATKTQLIAKLQALVATFDPSKPAQRRAVCSTLKVFTTAVQLLSGHVIPAGQAAEWIADANRIRTVLAC